MASKKTNLEKRLAECKQNLQERGAFNLPADHKNAIFYDHLADKGHADRRELDFGIVRYTYKEKPEQLTFVTDNA